MLRLIFTFLLFCDFAVAKSITQDIGSDLEGVIEYEKIEGSCDRYFDLLDSNNAVMPKHLDKPQTIELEIKCGKWIFFYLGIKSNIGIPESLLRSLKFYFEDDIGANYSGLGFFSDPNFEGQALGLVPVKPHNKKIKDLVVPKQRQISCAGCHVGQLPDGRYSVGMPNENLDISKFNKYMVFPLWLISKEKNNQSVFLPELIRFYEDLREKMREAPRHIPNTLDLSALSGRIFPSAWMYRLIEQSPPSIGDQITYLNGRPGVFNPASPLISFNGREIYTSTPSLWGLTHRENDPRLSYLGTITSAPYLEAFIKHAFVYTTFTSDYSNDKYVRPLASYLRSLKAPKNPVEVNPSSVLEGEKLFRDNCISCHDGPHGESSHRVSIEEINTPWQLSGIFEDYIDPNQQSQKLIEQLQEAFEFEQITSGIKSRRLNGIWARNFLMHNGSIDGLDHLFCLNGQSRDRFSNEALTDLVHSDLCTLPLADKLSLKQYLLSL